MPATGASTRRAPGRTARRPTAANGASSPSPTWRRRASRRARDVKFGLEDFKRYFTEVATFPIIPPDITSDPAEYLVSSGLACIGTPDDCIRHFERLWKGSNGGFGGVLLLAHNWADWPATRRSYELMARYVHPHFQRNANELRDWSYNDAKAKYETAGAQSKAAVQAAMGPDFKAPANFTYRLTDAEITEIDAAVRAVAQRDIDFAAIDQRNFELPRLGRYFASIRDDVLLRGRGFMVIRGLPVECYSIEAGCRSISRHWRVFREAGVAEWEGSYPRPCEGPWTQHR